MIEFNRLDEDVFEEFYLTRNIKTKTQLGYRTALTQYMNVTGLHLQEFLDEADYDEDNVSSLKKRRIKKHLLKYRVSLVDEYDSAYTIRTYFNKVKTFYRHNEIQLPYIPPLKLDSSYELNYRDLPSHEELLFVCEHYDLLISSLVLFMSSSGQAMAETLSLTVNDFIEALKEFTEEVDPYKVLDDLEYRDDIIPTFYMRRLKTDKYYFTFCSPEATREIIRYLKYDRVTFNIDEALWNISKNKLTNIFQEINDSNGWGRKGKYRKFRSHTIRKFNASNIGMQPEDVDKIQGRSRSILHETYIKVNPSSLKRTYSECVENVMLGLDDDYFNNDKILDEFEDDKMKHIYKVGPHKWKVVKSIYNKRVEFGVYSQLIYAVRARNLLTRVNWKPELLRDEDKELIENYKE